MKFLDAPVTGAVAPQPVNVDGESTFRILEAYKVWLHREHEELSRDIYPDQPDPLSHFNLETVAENFHYEAPDEPPPARPHTRARLVLEAVGAIASRRIPADADPIFAAIDAHRAAVARYRAAIRDKRRLKETLPGNRTRSVVTVWEDTIANTDAPEWIASERLVKRMLDLACEGALDILRTPPTTLAGAIDLLRYVADFDARSSAMPGNFTDFADDPENSRAGNKRGWAYHAQRMIADALYAMADARNCPDGFTPVMADGELQFLSNRAFADLSVSRRAEIAVINPETCFDRPTGEATKREISQAA